jgi:transcriptional regulator with XRE-family HTH domain
MRVKLSDRFFGRLWEIQEQCGFNNVTLARKLGISQSHLSRIKSGERNKKPSMQFLLSAVREFPDLAVFLASPELIESNDDVPSSNTRGEIVRATVAERLERLSIPEPNSGCWLWLGCLNQGGYGSIAIGRCPRGAHRVSYETFVGPIEDGLEVDHLCRNRACINPRHLEPVTPAENTRRSMVARGLATACKRGHAFDDENTYVIKGGGRLCRRCVLARHRAKRHGLPLSEAMNV